MIDPVLPHDLDDLYGVGAEQAEMAPREFTTYYATLDSVYECQVVNWGEHYVQALSITNVLHAGVDDPTTAPFLNKSRCYATLVLALIAHSQMIAEEYARKKHRVDTLLFETSSETLRT